MPLLAGLLLLAELAVNAESAAGKTAARVATAAFLAVVNAAIAAAGDVNAISWLFLAELL
jgi:hypothetical protein